METRAVSRLPTRLFQCAVAPFFNHILYLIDRKPDEKKIPPPRQFRIQSSAALEDCSIRRRRCTWSQPSRCEVTTYGWSHI